MKTDYILVTGLSGAGKTTFCSFLETYKNLKFINAGDCLRSHMKERGVILGDRINTGKDFLYHFTEGDVFTAIIKQTQAQKVKVIDGVRLLSTCISFRNSFENVYIIFIDVNEKIRRKRFMERLLKDNHTLEHANKIISQKDIYFDEIMKGKLFANTIINNDGTLEHLKVFAKKISV